MLSPSKRSSDTAASAVAQTDVLGHEQVHIKLVAEHLWTSSSVLSGRYHRISIVCSQRAEHARDGQMSDSSTQESDGHKQTPPRHALGDRDCGLQGWITGLDTASRLSTRR
jgi:hypothetical protein